MKRVSGAPGLVRHGGRPGTSLSRASAIRPESQCSHQIGWDAQLSDEPRLLPNTCFFLEPGIYLPEFGVRSEIDMLTSPIKAWVTGKIQRELVRI
jgi:Xaa-Pro aminopeptidase